MERAVVGASGGAAEGAREGAAVDGRGGVPAVEQRGERRRRAPRARASAAAARTAGAGSLSASRSGRSAPARGVAASERAAAARSVAEGARSDGAIAAAARALPVRPEEREDRRGLALAAALRALAHRDEQVEGLGAERAGPLREGREAVERGLVEARRRALAAAEEEARRADARDRRRGAREEREQGLARARLPERREREGARRGGDRRALQATQEGPRGLVAAERAEGGEEVGFELDGRRFFERRDARPAELAEARQHAERLARGLAVDELPRPSNHLDEHVDGRGRRDAAERLDRDHREPRPRRGRSFTRLAERHYGEVGDGARRARTERAHRPHGRLADLRRGVVEGRDEGPLRAGIADGTERVGPRDADLGDRVLQRAEQREDGARVAEVAERADGLDADVALGVGDSVEQGHGGASARDGDGGAHRGEADAHLRVGEHALERPERPLDAQRPERADRREARLGVRPVEPPDEARRGLDEPEARGERGGLHSNGRGVVVERAEHQRAGRRVARARGLDEDLPAALGRGPLHLRGERRGAPRPVEARERRRGGEGERGEAGGGRGSHARSLPAKVSSAVPSC
ncbi:MAG: hypothetical protein U0324_06795 [Polyangiales bacterium]